MKRQVRFAGAARSDIERLYRFLAGQDVPAARASLRVLRKAWELLREFPFAGHSADPANSLVRELLIPFGGAGYVALYEIEDDHTITHLAVRHQREDDYR